jgi:hypothetical protein
MESQTHPGTTFRNAKLATLASFLLISLMMACVVSTLLIVIQLIYPGLQAGFIVPLSILIGLEASFSQRSLRNRSFPDSRWIAHRITEFIVIIVLLRLSVYWINGFSQFWVDLQAWPDRFWDSMVTLDTLIILGMGFFAWGASNILAEDVLQLEIDEHRLNIEMLGVEVEDRSQAQLRLRDGVMFIGCGMIIATAIIRIAGRSDQAPDAVIQTTYLNVVIYFLLALVLFSLTQFSVLRVNWLVQRIRIHSGIAGRWFLYSLGFIGLLALIAIALPTRYSVGLLDTLSYIFYWLLNALRVLISIILLPIIIFINWLMSLFRSPKSEPTSPPIPLPNIAINPVSFQADWLEVVKSIGFWAIVISLVGYALYTSLSENKWLIHNIRRIPIFGLIADVIHRFMAWIRRVNHKLAITIESSLERYRHHPEVDKEPRLWRFTSPRRMTPRERVVFFYLVMLRRGGEAGLPISPGQTPREYSDRLASVLSGGEAKTNSSGLNVAGEIESLTDEFLEARYSQHPITNDHANRAKILWYQIRQAMQIGLGRGKRTHE